MVRTRTKLSTILNIVAFVGATGSFIVAASNLLQQGKNLSDNNNQNVIIVPPSQVIQSNVNNADDGFFGAKIVPDIEPNELLIKFSPNFSGDPRKKIESIFSLVPPQDLESSIDATPTATMEDGIGAEKTIETNISAPESEQFTRFYKWPKVSQIDAIVNESVNIDNQIRSTFSSRSSSVLENNGVSATRALMYRQEMARWRRVRLTGDIDPFWVSTAVMYQKDPDIETIQPNFKIRLLDQPNDPFFSSQNSWGRGYEDLWGLRSMNFPKAWEITTGSPNITVAVIDTGVDAKHADLKNNVLSGLSKTFIGRNTNDAIGHGTHVAGTIAAESNNGIGVASACWRCKILNVKIFDRTGSADMYDTVAAIKYAVDQGARVINMSWGGYGGFVASGNYIFDLPLLKEVFEYADARGVVLVAAAGNDDYNTLFQYPAQSAKVIAVAAESTGGGAAVFTNRGYGTDFTAPGEQILSLKASGGLKIGTVVDKKYMVLSGTSMATPHVAGAAALVLSQRPDLTPIEVFNILRSSTSNQYYCSASSCMPGYGKIDVAKALSLVNNWGSTNHPPNDPIISGPFYDNVNQDARRPSYRVRVSDPDGDPMRVRLQFFAINGMSSLGYTGGGGETRYNVPSGSDFIFNPNESFSAQNDYRRGVPYMFRVIAIDTGPGGDSDITKNLNSNWSNSAIEQEAPSITDYGGLPDLICLRQTYTINFKAVNPPAGKIRAILKGIGLKANGEAVTDFIPLAETPLLPHGTPVSLSFSWTKPKAKGLALYFSFRDEFNRGNALWLDTAKVVKCK